MVDSLTPPDPATAAGAGAPGSPPSTFPDGLPWDLDLELSASLSLSGTALRVLDLVRSRYADWAMLVVTEPHTRHVVMFGGDDPDFSAASRNISRTRVVHDVLTGGERTLEHVEPGDPRDLLSRVVPHPGLRSQVAALEPVDVLTVPLRAHDDTVGALVLVRKAGEGFAAPDLDRIERVCGRAALALDSSRVFEEQARVTRVLQESLRPPELAKIPGVDVAACFHAAAAHLEIGGDFYDVHGEDGDWIVVLGDVCGKGAEAAVLNARARQSIRTAARFDRRPGQILSALNEVLYDDTSDRFVTVVCCRLRPTGEGSYRADLAVAGHPPPLVVRVDGQVEQPEVTGRLAGALLHGDAYEEVGVELRSGDALVLFSDGVLEAHGADGLFGIERLQRLVGRYAGAGAAGLVGAIEREVMAHLDDNVHDDMTALAVVPD